MKFVCDSKYFLSAFIKFGQYSINKFCNINKALRYSSFFIFFLILCSEFSFEAMFFILLKNKSNSLCLSTLIISYENFSFNFSEPIGLYRPRRAE